MKKGKLTALSAISIILCWVFLNLVIIILTAAKFSYFLYWMPIIFNTFILGSIKLFLDLTGRQDAFLRWWRDLPIFTHIGIVSFCLLWILALSYAILPSVLKKDYERSK